ncbi:MAG: hemerythrin family protein [Alphaproteobacteria bacterium]|nr:hemerythrin family protein [Alphaproteobacteria bacterium]
MGSAMLVEWGEKLKTGWSFMDDDHRRFVELLNDLHDNSLGASSNFAAPSMVGELIAVMRAHFDSEETVMQQIRYPKLPDHRAQHDLMRRKLDALTADLDACTGIAVDELIDLLSTWLAQHIAGCDRDLARRISRRFSIGR